MKTKEPKAHGAYYTTTYHTTEVHDFIVKEAKKYEADEFELFIAEQGWQDWMNDYTQEPEDKECLERELKVMTDIQRECFNEAHKIT